MQFRDLEPGDSFDFVGPRHLAACLPARCTKLSARTYVRADDDEQRTRVAPSDAAVFHVELKRE